MALLRLCQVLQPTSSAYFPGARAGTLALAVCIKPGGKATPADLAAICGQLSSLIHGNTNRRFPVPAPRLSTCCPGASCQLLCTCPVPLAEVKTPKNWGCPSRTTTVRTAKDSSQAEGHLRVRAGTTPRMWLGTEKVRGEKAKQDHRHFAGSFGDF